MKMLPGELIIFKQFLMLSVNSGHSHSNTWNNTDHDDETADDDDETTDDDVMSFNNISEYCIRFVWISRMICILKHN